VQVSTIYLFHELPGQARKDAVAEMVRVLKPGGLLVFNDGNQLGDRPINDATQGNFQAFNEPNWGTHIALDYGECLPCAWDCFNGPVSPQSAALHVLFAVTCVNAALKQA